MTTTPQQPAEPPRRAQLTRAVIELEAHVAREGWDRGVRLFALVPTAELLAAQPALAATLGLAPEVAEQPGHLTPVEQEDLPEHASLEELLSGIAWPPEVRGAALTVERVMLPPEAESDLPADEAEALQWVARHPGRQEVRLAVGVLRDGTAECAVRMRAHDSDQEVLSGQDLVPGLVSALRETLTD